MRKTTSDVRVLICTVISTGIKSEINEKSNIRNPAGAIVRTNKGFPVLSEKINDLKKNKKEADTINVIV